MRLDDKVGEKRVPRWWVDVKWGEDKAQIRGTKVRRGEAFRGSGRSSGTSFRLGKS